MTDFTFSAEKREENAKKIRNAGKIPAIIYGKGFDPINISVDETAFNRLFRDAGSSNLVDLGVGDQKIKVLIHEIQTNPVTEKIEHIDFYKVNLKEKIKTEIPLEIIGETDLVINQEGSMIMNKDAVEVECLPSDLVDHIDVDVSVLTDFEQNIKVGDLRVSDKIEILDDPEEVVVIVQPPRSEEELEALNEEVVENVEAVEVEGEKAEGEEAGEAETAEGSEETPAEEKKEE
ncbi:MAG: 50S ribosomal protein L25 [Patescibacteria group bacterium]